MTISFSGLASGLDTSSWVESLVSLKQAKVTELEDEKDLVTTTKEAVANIKSFFTSFRSVLEKVTDTKFNVSTMDIFAQNLATSSNVDILSAIATAEAKEATYEINVDKLATSTQAASGYKFTTQIVTTTAATLDSKLANLGVKSGNIGVTVNGLEQNLYIADNDTIQTFIDKLNNLGVSASFNQDSGVFNMNIGINDINDKDNTGIIAALHLEGVNEGYQSDKLEITKTDTTFESADESTLLTDLGVKRGTLTIEANDAVYNVEIDNDTTLGEFLQALRDENINASLTDDGVFRLEDAVITNDGTTNLIDAFGLQQSVSSNIQQSGDLSYKTVVTDVTVATLDSLLNDITENGVSNGDTVVVKNSNNETSTIRLSSTSTLGDLFDGLKAAGMMAALNNDGTITISGGEITGGSFDAVREFGLVTTPTSSTVTGNVLQKTVTTTQLATEDTRLVKDLGVKAGALEVTTGDGTVHSITIDSGMTIGDLIDTYESLGISASIDTSGVLTVAGGSFSEVSGGTDLLTKLYGTDMVDNTNQNSAYSKTDALKYDIMVTETVEATLDSLINDVTQNGVSDGDTLIVRNSNNQTYTINLNSSSTLADMFSGLQNAGLRGTLNENGSITISGGEIIGGSFDAVGEFNLSSVTNSGMVSGSVLKETITTVNTATIDTRLVEDLGVKAGALKVETGDGTIHNVTITSGMTIGDLIDEYRDIGISASIDSSGVLTVNGGIFSTVSGGTDLLTKLYGTDMVDNTNQNSAYSKTDALKYDVMVTRTVEATLASLINDVTKNGVSNGDTLVVRNSNNQTHTINLNANSTLADMFTGLQNAGLRATLNENGSITISGGEIIGGSFDAVGEFNLSSVTNSGMVSGSVLKETITTVNTATSGTRLVEDLGVKAGALKVETSDGTTHNVMITSGMTIGDLIDEYRDIGISASIDSSGVLTVNGGIFSTVSGGTDLLTKLYGTDMVDNTNQNSAYSKTDALKYDVLVTKTVSATLDSLINDVAAIKVSNGATLEVRNANNQTYTINLNSSSTLADMFTGLQNAGLRATLNENGSITISGGEITGGSFDAVRAFNLSSVTNSGIVTGDSLQETITNINIATEDTRLVEDLGVKAGALKVTTDDGTTHNVTITSGMTIGDLIDAYDALGISASINSSGVLTVAGGSFSAVSGGTDLLTKLYGTDMVDNTTQNSAYSKSEALKYEITETVKATLDTKLGSMGLESDSAVSFSVKDVGTVSVTLSSSMTIQDMIDKLSSKGVSASFDSESAKLTISNAELTSATSPVSEIFGFTSIITGRYTSSKAVYGVQQEEVYANESTTLGMLGLSGGSILKHQVKLSVDGVVYNTYVTSATKMSQVIEWINSNGATATLTNGIFRIEGGAIIEGPLEVLLGLSTQTTIVQSTTEQTAGLSTTLAAVANTNDFKITFKDSATGAASTVYTFASDATFADLISVFADNDIDVTLTDGVLSFDTSAGTYATGALLDDFGVKSGAGIVGLAQSSTNLREEKTLTTNASSYTTFEDLGIDPTNMTICIEGNLNQCTTNTLTENSTLADFFNRLSSWGVGLTGSISNGVITIKSTLGNGNKLTGTLAEALGINWGSTTKWNSTSNVTYKKVVYTSTGGNGNLEINRPGNNNTGSTSSGLGSSVSTGGGTGGVTFQGTTVTCTATLDTTLSELGITSDQVITYSMAPSGGVTYQPARITIKSTDTLRTLKSKIASYASMTISSTGRVSIVENSSDGNLTLTSSIISALKLAETETYDTTASVTLSPISTTSTFGASLTTQLKNIQVSSWVLPLTYSITIGNVETGSLTTYTFASTDTIDDFVTTLKEAGVNATFSASTATVEIAAGGDGYITSMSNQIRSIFGFRTGEGDSYEYSDDGMSASGMLKESSNNSTTVPTSQTSVKPLMVTIEVQSTVTTDTKLSDLEDFNGTNLGITSGQVYVYTNGVRNTLNISSTETIGSLSSKLAAYGISIDMSNNQLYFNGNSNSYLTVTGLPVASASNILTKLGIQTWNTNYDTVSGSLVAEANSNGTANGDVKLVDLRGSNGNLLGITTGTYYIYDNGTKITATITSDMTVTDFLNTLNAHGISAGIGSDGSITLSGKNNSYIASSGGSNIVDTVIKRA